MLHDLLRGMGLQTVEDDEVVAGVGVTDERYGLPGDQIHSCQQRHRPMADVVGIPCDEPMLLGHGLILDGTAECLDVRLLIVRDRDDSRIGLSLDGYLRLLVDHQHLHHLLMEFRVAVLEIISDAMGLHPALLEDLPDHRFVDPGEIRIVVVDAYAEFIFFSSVEN